MRGKLAKKLDQREIVDFKELLISEVVRTEALVNFLERNGIICKYELLEEKQVNKERLKEKLRLSTKTEADS